MSSKYPDWNGQWRRPPGVNNQWDPSKPRYKEGAPLTPEYQAIYEANIKDQEEGGQGTDPTYTCIPDGMPRAMNVIFPMEIIIKPDTTYIMIEYLSMLRRIFTDGRQFPKDFPPAFMGYSIGHWVDTDGDGRYDQLEVETRNLKNPRSFDSSGLPLHADAETVVHEKFYTDKANPDVLHDEVTTVDNALTRPWTVVKNYNRVRNPIWVEFDLFGEQRPPQDRRRGLHAQRRRLPDAGKEGPTGPEPQVLREALRGACGPVIARRLQRPAPAARHAGSRVKISSRVRPQAYGSARENSANCV